MRTIFDPKSVLLGAIIAVVLGCAVAANDPDDPASLRFQIESNEQHVFVLDTATGQVWSKYLPPNQGTTSENFGGSKLDPQP